jgi:hypothetical protein
MGDLARLAVLMLVAGCGHADDRIDTCLDLCPHMVECGAYGTAEACDSGCHVYIYSDPCLSAIADAECSEIAATDAVCFPPCTTSESTCVDNVLVTCSLGHEYSIRCRELCTSEGRDYAGTCGKTAGEQTSPVDVCWCVEWSS